MELTWENWKDETLRCVAMITCLKPTEEYVYNCAKMAYISMRDFLLINLKEENYDISTIPDDWDTVDILFHLVGQHPRLANIMLTLEDVYISPPVHIEEILYKLVPITNETLGIMLRHLLILLLVKGIKFGYEDDCESYVLFGKSCSGEFCTANCFSVYDSIG